MLRDYQAQLLKEYLDENWQNFQNWLNHRGYEDFEEISERIIEDLKGIADE